MKKVFTEANVISMASTMSEASGYQCQPGSAIAVENGKIVALGEQAKQLDWPKQSLNGALVTPGLIDSHTHLVFAGNRASEFEQRLNGVPYQTIAEQGGGILSTVNATRTASEDELLRLALPRADALMRDGVTTIEIKSGYGLTFEDELKMLRVARAIEQHLPVNVSTTLLAAHALPPEYQHDADHYIDFVCHTLIPAAAEQQLADAVDVFCEKIAFSVDQAEKVYAAANAHGLKIKAHTEQLSDLGGSVAAAKAGALSVDHIEYLSEADAQLLAEFGTVATLLPGAFYFLRETQHPPIQALRDDQVPMALATDFNPGTSPFASLTLMMNMASTFFRLTPKENLYGVTRHAAQAMGLESKGQIAVGFDADLAVWHCQSPAELSYMVGTAPLAGRIVGGTWYDNQGIRG
ncbi:imidazolonepropionase [Salinivibrio sharmensis]|uniref:Imidazolonepropionase n=1 Tax=Salinivibrio sharmensis TaxID=390883 RepID=A0ABX3KGQ6_9GAMM|nr:imidazolonepropionase [Salinivibrio sharmensis]OOE88223.1 imidazolonepropionase [Salinivibrio sharmensis]